MSKTTNRRTFLEAIALTAAATTFSIPTALAGSKKEGEHIEFEFLTSPYLQALTPTSVSIVCITSSVASTWVEYGEGVPSTSEYAEQDGLNDAYQTLFNIQLTDLKPDTRYAYRVVSKEIESFEPYKLVYGKEIRSDTFHFTTPAVDSDQVACLILNDIHDRPHSFRDLISLNENVPYDFVLLNGDMFDYQIDEKQLIDHLIKPCTEIFAKEKPFILSRGNHETRGKFSRNIKPYFSYPGKNYYHSFKQGPVYWIVLDTGEDKPDDAPVYAGIVNFDDYRKKQAIWLQNIMGSKEYQEAPFKVVLMHIPPFHSGDWHGTIHCRKLFTPLFEKYKIDMVIAGHTHKYGVHKPQDDHTYPIVIGGGPREGTRTLLRLDATVKDLKMVMKSDDGKVVGEYGISKKYS
jgi:predicted phosphodiesterase